MSRVFADFCHSVQIPSENEIAIRRKNLHLKARSDLSVRYEMTGGSKSATIAAKDLIGSDLGGFPAVTTTCVVSSLDEVHRVAECQHAKTAIGADQLSWRLARSSGEEDVLIIDTGIQDSIPIDNWGKVPFSIAGGDSGHNLALADAVLGRHLLAFTNDMDSPTFGYQYREVVGSRVATAPAQEVHRPKNDE